MSIDEKLLDKLAEMEVEALLEGLQKEHLRENPAFLEKVRKFLSQNKLKTTPETPGISKIKKITAEIPIFDDIEVQ